MSDQYKVVNPTSLFAGRIGCKAGTGYDSVCDNCGGKGEHPKY